MQGPVPPPLCGDDLPGVASRMSRPDRPAGLTSRTSPSPAWRAPARPRKEPTVGFWMPQLTAISPNAVRNRLRRPGRIPRDTANASGIGPEPGRVRGDGPSQHPEEIPSGAGIVRKVTGGFVPGDEDDGAPRAEQRDHRRRSGEGGEETSGEESGGALHHSSWAGGHVERELDVAIQRFGSQPSAQRSDAGRVVGTDHVESHLDSSDVPPRLLALMVTQVTPWPPPWFGVMNESTSLAGVRRRLDGPGSLLAIAVELAHMPMGPLARTHGFPDRALKALADGHTGA
jgi:hypothetical protein